jgi:hypothetical protein
MKNAWLIWFNVVTLLAWVLFFLHAGVRGFQFDDQDLMILAIAQGLAIFEVINSIFKLVGANWMLTSMQVSSRFLVVGLLWWMPLDLVVGLGFFLVSITWGITEIIRAAFYLSELFEKRIQGLLWMRYTFFIVLYPIGVLGEFMIMFSVIEWRGLNHDLINVVLGIIALLYVVFFPKLYMYMFGQRRKKLA